MRAFVLIAATLGSIVPVPELGTSRADVIRIRILDRETLHTYEVSTGPDGPVLRSRSQADAKSGSRAREDVQKEFSQLRHAVQSARREAARDDRGTEKAKWATPSPDRSHVLVGYENPVADALRSAEVRTADGRSKWPLVLRGYIEDATWTSDSRIVVLLEHTDRWLKSPRGLLRLLAGHPVPISTFYVTACNVELRRCQSLQLVADLEFATGQFLP